MVDLEQVNVSWVSILRDVRTAKLNNFHCILQGVLIALI